MRIAVYLLFNSEYFSLLFQVNRYINIEGISIRREAFVVFIFYRPASKPV